MKPITIALAAAALASAPALTYVLIGGSLEAAPSLAQIKVGTAVPDFSVPDADGRAVSLAQFRGKPVILEWSNPECPSVKKHYESGNMQKTQAAAAEAGVIWLTINSSANGKQGYLTPAQAKSLITVQQSRRTAYLLDPEGAVGKAYGATTTPHIYVINAAGNLIYNGAIDDRPTTDKADIPAARNHVLAALAELKAGKPVSVPTSRPYGCSVKYG